MEQKRKRSRRRRGRKRRRRRRKRRSRRGNKNRRRKTRGERREEEEDEDEEEALLSLLPSLSLPSLLCSQLSLMSLPSFPYSPPSCLWPFFLFHYMTHTPLVPFLNCPRQTGESAYQPAVCRLPPPFDCVIVKLIIVQVVIHIGPPGPVWGECGIEHSSAWGRVMGYLAHFR